MVRGPRAPLHTEGWGRGPAGPFAAVERNLFGKTARRPSWKATCNGLDRERAAPKKEHPNAEKGPRKRHSERPLRRPQRKAQEKVPQAPGRHMGRDFGILRYSQG